MTTTITTINGSDTLKASRSTINTNFSNLNLLYTETPSGLVNGSNLTYTVLHSINSIYSFAINGQYLHPYSGGVGDYTFSGSTITMQTVLPASLSGLPFTIVYS